MRRRRVLLLEINEITWSLIDPLIQQGKLPTFSRLKNEGTWAAPLSVDLPPQLDPWITWTTVYTGRPQMDHNVYFLQQPPETIRAKRIWQICHENGLRVGVYGSLCSWPPLQVDGFYVPDTFAPDPSTHPQSLRPIQELNLKYTRSIRLPTDNDGILFKAKLGLQLMHLGLRGRTIAQITRHLVQERRRPETRWQRVALQPFVNFDFFSRLYRRYQPEFASFHTNHVAHYMHTYWKAMNPTLFPQETTPDEVEKYGRAIEFGYRAADELLKNMLELVPSSTVLMVASSMGQQPFISELKKGKRIGQVRSLEHLVDLLGARGRVKPLSTMSDQFNLYADSAATRDEIIAKLKAAYVGSPGRPMFFVAKMAETITVNLCHCDDFLEDSICVLNGNRFLYKDLVYSTGITKSGCHHPQGFMLLYGDGINPGGHIAECSNLDIAPTLLELLAIPVPAVMKGRILHEALAEASAA